VRFEIPYDNIEKKSKGRSQKVKGKRKQAIVNKVISDQLQFSVSLNSKKFIIG